MPSQADKTEQPTQRRKVKSREQGQFASSREFVSSLQFVFFLFLVGSYGAAWFLDTRENMARQLKNVADQQVDVRSVYNLFMSLCAHNFLPMLKAGALLVVITIAVQLASTGLGFSFNRLAPKADRFNPIAKLRDLPKQTIPSTFSSLLLLVVFGFTLYWLITERLQTILLLTLTDFGSGLQAASGMALDLLWRGAGVLFIVGAVDYGRALRRHTQQLKMTKQEVRDEMKDTDGNPMVKMRIRRLQREMRRNRMMKDVESATAVIVNPTHVAVALRYDHGSSGAPVVVGKGRGFIALKMREVAEKAGVPIVENIPLARALYKATELRQEIPPALYRAVAEVLAYVYRLTHSGQNARR
jgi:flagellar biosynthetic protein FlhB